MPSVTWTHNTHHFIDVLGTTQLGVCIDLCVFPIVGHCISAWIKSDFSI